VRANLSLLRRLPGAGRLLRALGASGVPVAGYFGAGWPIGTMLLLYWIESVLVILSVVVLVQRHRAVTSGPGRRAGGNDSFLGEFLSVVVTFTLGHGVFVALFAFLVFPDLIGPSAGVSARSLGVGALSIAGFLLAGLLFDLYRVGEQPFGWVRRYGDQAKRRMVVTHLTIIFGAIALFATESPIAFLAVFVGLKAVADLVAILAERRTEERAPAVGG
jgi:hypothetical protein